MPGKVFATVGTTKFDALVRALDDPAVAAALADRGYDSLTIQLGAGAYRPCHILPPGRTSGDAAGGRLHVTWFEFAPTLAQQLASADLVISHAGSGSIFEALGAGKALLVVPNEALMDNHQAELAQELAARGHLATCAPSGLLAALCQLDVSRLVPYQSGSPAGIVKVIDKLMGFAD